MTVLLRYVAYACGTGALVGLLVLLEVEFPGALGLQEFRGPTDALGTSEYSLVENLQLLLILVSGFVFGAVAWWHRGQRPVAVGFAAVALACLVRELDYFLDLWFADNLWQVLLAVVVAVGGAYLLRHRRRYAVGWARLWPSPAATLLFAGAVVLFLFSNLIGHETFWRALQGEHYRRVAKLAMEEMTELAGYALCFCGAVEYYLEARHLEGAGSPGHRERLARLLGRP